MKTAILTDTNSGISADFAEKNKIYLISMPIIIDNQVFYEGKNITEEKFFDFLKNGKNISTSQPSPTEVINKWDSILNSGYDELVYIPMSSGLSSSCETAKNLSLKLKYKNKVLVVDNRRISVTMRNSVLQAKSLADQEIAGIDIKKILEEDAYNSSIYLAVNDINFLKKSGRISKHAALIGNFLSIKPILTILGGKIEPFAKIRGNMKKCELKMIDAIKNDLETKFANNNISRLIIGAAGAGLNSDEISEWLEILKNNFKSANICYNSLSSSISCHTGPGAVGVGISFEYKF
ncbi:MAG: DegV family protein [Clostridia bacterium]|nr:DegV family protein [Clostridia bacterium]